MDKAYSAGKIRQEMNWQPAYTLEESLRVTLLTGAGKDPNELEVVARLHVVMVDDVEMGRNLIRTVFGAYAATPGYNKCFEWIGFEQEARQIREAYARRDRAGVAAGVTDRLSDAMAVVGNKEAVRARLRAYAEAGIGPDDIDLAQLQDTESGAEIEPNDPNWDRLKLQAAKAKDEQAAWLEMEDIYGGRWDLEADPIKHAQLMIAHIDKKRAALGIDKARERQLMTMADRQALEA